MADIKKILGAQVAQLKRMLDQQVKTLADTDQRRKRAETRLAQAEQLLSEDTDSPDWRARVADFQRVADIETAHLDDTVSLCGWDDVEQETESTTAERSKT